MRLLIVEDEDTLCESLKRVFMRDGYDVDMALSAELALDLFSRKPYDLIITDIILPGKSGIDFLKLCKTVNPLQKIIIMTASMNEEVAQSALSAGADNYILKPFGHEEIKKMVADTLTGGKS